MSTIEQTASEFFESLNGFDEIAITKAFGRTVIVMSDTDQMMFARSLVFVAQRRAGMNDKDAYTAALSMTVREVNEYFAPEEDETVPDDPDSESGKGERQHESLPKSLQLSAS